MSLLNCWFKTTNDRNATGKDLGGKRGGGRRRRHGGSGGGGGGDSLDDVELDPDEEPTRATEAELATNPQDHKDDSLLVANVVAFVIMQTIASEMPGIL